MPHLSTTDADIAQRLNQYELKRELLRAEINHPPDGFTLDWLTDKEQDIRTCQLFIATLKGVLNA